MLLHALPASGASVPLTPLVSGVFTGGDGANSYWAQVENSWIGPSTDSQGLGGGGIWGLEDAYAVLAMSPGDDGFVRSASGAMTTINAGNDRYNTDWGATWGFVEMPPLFVTGDLNQENYAAHIWGYIAVPVAGDYNFGVLYDDGFAFTLWGAEGPHSMSVDGLNSRDNKGFDSDFAMEPGFYRFDLVGYQRLEAGVLSLGWWSPMSDDFAIIPQDNLHTTVVPVPAALWLFGSGLVALIGFARRKKN